MLGPCQINGLYEYLLRLFADLLGNRVMSTKTCIVFEYVHRRKCIIPIQYDDKTILEIQDLQKLLSTLNQRLVF